MLLCWIHLSALVVSLWNIWGSLCSVSCHLQIKTVLLLPFQFGCLLFIYFFLSDCYGYLSHSFLKAIALLDFQSIWTLLFLLFICLAASTINALIWVIHLGHKIVLKSLNARLNQDFSTLASSFSSVVSNALNPLVPSS